MTDLQHDGYNFGNPVVHLWACRPVMEWWVRAQSPGASLFFYSLEFCPRLYLTASATGVLGWEATGHYSIVCQERQVAVGWCECLSASLYVPLNRVPTAAWWLCPCRCPSKYSLGTAFQLVASGQEAIHGLGDRNTMKGTWSHHHPLPSARTDLNQTATLGRGELASDKPQLWEMLGQCINIICKQLGRRCSFSAILRS